MTKRLLLTPALLLTLGAAAALGQTAPASTQPRGLDALSEDRLMAELANRGLETLLDRAFDVNDVPEPERRGVRTLIALRELTDRDARLSLTERRQLVEQVVAGIEHALPSMDDPRLLMQQAAALIRGGMERDVNTLEYWGASARTQRTLRPVAEIVVKLLDKAATRAEAEADRLAQEARSLQDPRVAQSEAMVNLATSARYTRHMADYYLALSLDADDPRRREIVDAAVAYLALFDAPESQVQPVVRNRMAKMHLLIGEFDKARELFASVATNPNGQIQPAPDAAQRYEARYFGAVAEVVAGDLPAARAALDELVQWQRTGLPPDDRTQAGAAAAVAMLEYRIHKLGAEQASTPARRREAEDAARATLMALVRQQPQLQTVIYEQLTADLPPNPDLKGLDALLLQALLREGELERLKPPGEPVDDEVLHRAIAAANEIVRRRNEPGSQVDAHLAETSALLVPFFLERLDRPADAVAAFVEFIRLFPDSRPNATLALDNALALVAQLRQDAPEAASTVRAYEQVLPVAIDPPFNRKQFAYEWARRLQLLGRHGAAAEYFAQVPDDDPRKLRAQFYEVLSLQQRLDGERLDAREREQVVAAILARGQEVRDRAQQAMAAAASEQDRQINRSLIARTTLLAADLARRERDDPARALDLLEGFEESAAGLPNEQELLNGALFTRVQSYMQLGQNDRATQTLLALLGSRGGSEGAGIVFNLLQKLNADLDRARAAGDVEQMRTIAQNRAALSGTLVDWARNNADENIRRYTYRYAVFDAATKHLAAELESDASRREQGLREALALYEALLSPENAQLYRQTIDPGSDIDPSAPDPQVQLGLGLIQYDLGHYDDARRRLGALLAERRLGAPTRTVKEDDQLRIEPNDAYWEAVLKLLRSNVAVATSDPSHQNLRIESESFLKQLYIQWGKHLAGTKWAPEFEQLRQEIIPEFQPQDLSTTQPLAGS